MQSDFCRYVNGLAKHVYHHKHVFAALLFGSSLDGCRMDAMIDSAGGNEYGGGEYASTQEHDKQGSPLRERDWCIPQNNNHWL